MHCNLINCRRCGALIEKTIRGTCPECTAIEDAEVQKIYDLTDALGDNDFLSVEEISEKSEISVEDIEKYLRRGRISRVSDRIAHKCKVCGAVLHNVRLKGFMCDECIIKMGKDPAQRKKQLSEPQVKLKTEKNPRGIKKGVLNTNYQKQNDKSNKYGFGKGFSLAEIIITMIITGIIAYLAIPTTANLVDTQNNKKYIRLFKMVRHTVGEVVSDVDTKYLSNSFCTDFTNKLNTIGAVDCTTSTAPTANDDANRGIPNFVLSNGTRFFGMEGTTFDSVTTADITVDTNGRDLPNEDDHDLFQLRIHRDGFVEPIPDSVDPIGNTTLEEELILTQLILDQFNTVNEVLIETELENNATANTYMSTTVAQNIVNANTLPNQIYERANYHESRILRDSLEVLEARTTLKYYGD